jgi:hypothetical protein
VKAQGQIVAGTRYAAGWRGVVCLPNTPKRWENNSKTNACVCLDDRRGLGLSSAHGDVIDRDKWAAAPDRLVGPNACLRSSASAT